ncbi:MAG: phosphohydrolase [Candidatus Bipolaricaulota bacterium]|nr:MAG: phosphohydrolase [Candidatus Bipolaricaulota bacterium]
MSFRCPGLDGREITAKTVPCPACGRDVEIFSDEASARCPHCRVRVTQDPAASCRQWCNGCLGDPQRVEGST